MTGWAQTVLAVLLSAIAAPAFPRAEIIYDSGQTRPIEPYMQPWRDIEKAVQRRRPGRKRKIRNLAQVWKRLFPIETPEMKPGPIGTMVMDEQARQRFALKGRAIFLLGSDKKSITWLQENRNVLAEKGAVGLLVQARSIADLQRVRKAGGGLLIAPAPGTAFYEQLGATRYPVLISAQGFQQ